MTKTRTTAGAENGISTGKCPVLDAGVARRLFTPFYSTRKGGQGIGLMFVREVLNRHGCSFALAPGADGETRFDIWFPSRPAAVAAAA